MDIMYFVYYFTFYKCEKGKNDCGIEQPETPQASLNPLSGQFTR